MFTVQDVLAILGLVLTVMGGAFWQVVRYINAERDKLAGEIERCRERIHALANRTQSKMDDFATREDLDRLERLLIAARGPHHGDE